uniref:Uncharacterized protein n=1 Tax=Glossina palpalis gambiensis TaxID=67801 RepID=A0A1B0BEY5_9MUSC
MPSRLRACRTPIVCKSRIKIMIMALAEERMVLKDGEEEEEEEIYNYFKFLHNYTSVLTDMTILTTLLTSTRKYSMPYKGLSSLTYTLSMGNNERLLRTIGKGTSRDEDEDEDEKQREITMKWQVCQQVLRLWVTLQELIARIVYYANDWLLRVICQSKQGVLQAE